MTPKFKLGDVVIIREPGTIGPSWSKGAEGVITDIEPHGTYKVKLLYGTAWLIYEHCLEKVND